MNIQPPTVVKLSIADDGTLSGAFYMGDHSLGLVTIPSGWTAANMGFKVCDTEGGTYTILRDDSTDAPVQIANIATAAAKTYVIPTKVFPALWIKLWSKSATAATETDVQQSGGPLAITVILK